MRHLLLLALTIVLALPASAAARRTAAVRSARTAAARSARVAAVAVRIALRERGVRYTWGGTSPATGFDCSGFTRWVYAHLGVELPHSSYAQFDYGRHVPRGSLRPGDLVFSNGLGHVGIYVGHGLFVHAPHTGSTVRVDSVAEYGFDGARRLRAV